MTDKQEERESEMNGGWGGERTNIHKGHKEMRKSRDKDIK